MYCSKGIIINIIRMLLYVKFHLLQQHLFTSSSTHTNFNITCKIAAQFLAEPWRIVELAT